jgi:hypothetical protein
MSKQTINIGASPNDGTGTPLRTSFDYTNQNFTELYNALGGGVGLPGSANQIIFNNGSSLAGDADLFWNSTLNFLTVTGSAIITADLTVDGGTLKVDSTNNFVGINKTPVVALDVSGSAAITGDLTVDTSTLKVDSTNDRVGIGTASPAAGAKLGVFGATSVSASDYIGASTWAARFIGSSNGASSGISFLTNSASGQATPASIHATPIADYRSALVATFSADASGAGYFAVNQFTPVGSSTLERFRVNRNGAVVLGGGTVDANGVGIAFPATQVASSDANCLDDYEEGTWTPVFQGTSTNGTYVYSTQVGRYTKVGNLVTVFGHLVISSITTAATGVMRIGGLPFTTSSVNVYAAATVGWVDLITISSGTLALSVNTGGVVIDMYRILSGAGVGFITPSDLVVNTRINFTATYFV